MPQSSPRAPAGQDSSESAGTNEKNPTRVAKPTFGNLRFRHGSSARYDSEFAKDQRWVKISGRVCSEFVDELPELDEFYAATPKQKDVISPGLRRANSHTTGSPAGSVAAVSVVSEDAASFIPPSSPWTPQSLYSNIQLASPSKRRRTNDSDGHSFPRPALPSDRIPSTNVIDNPDEAVTDRVDADAINSLLQAADYSDQAKRHSLSFSSASHDFLHTYGPVQHETPGIWPHADIQEACLMRYFIDELACWFDLCDPERHFALIVPQRARGCPALLNAIYTASARHLCRLDQYKIENSVQYLEKRLSELHIETAVEYHSRCIEHLVSASDDPEAIYDENLLVASIILRFYEEVDAPLNGGDWETGLQGTGVFIEAQAPCGFESGLRRAAFRVACRQEVYMSFTRQRVFQLPLNCDDYRTLEPTDDHTWAHRVVVHCADVLRHCYGENQSDKSGYDALVEYHRGWDTVRPKSFEPIFEQSADSSHGEVFPELWYLSDCHVTAVQHFELSRILLTVYDPRMSRLGPSHRAAVKRIEAEINITVKRLCGIAISNRRAPPAMNTACMAIAMCGDQFTDRREQRSLLDVLVYTDEKHAWPTTEIQARLKEAWGWIEE